MAIGDVHAPLATGEQGELAVDARAKATFAAYLDDPVETECRLVDGWYLAGDAAHRGG